MRKWYSKLQNYCFRFVFACNRNRRPYGQRIDLIIEAFSLQSLIYLYLNRRIAYMETTPLIFSFVKNYLELTEFDSLGLQLTSLFFWIFLSLPILIVILNSIVVILPIRGVSIVVSGCMTVMPIFYSNIISLFFYSDGTAFCEIFKAAALLCTLTLFSIHIFSNNQTRRIPQMLATLSITIWSQHTLLVLCLLTLANSIIYFRLRRHPQNFFRACFPPILLMYSLHTHFGYVSQINDIQLIVAVLLSVPIQMILGVSWIEDNRRNALVEEDSLENTIKMVGIVMDHYDKCHNDGCVCAELDGHSGQLVEDCRLARDIVIKLKKCEKEFKMYSFQESAEYAEFAIVQMNYALKGIAVLCKLTPKTCDQRFRAYCLGEVYKKSMMEGMKIRNQKSSQEIQRTYHDYEKYRLEMGRFVKKLIEFYKQVKLQPNLNVNLFNNMAVGLAHLELTRKQIIKYQPSCEFIKYIFNVFQQLILNQKIKVDVVKEVIIDPYAIFRKNMLARCNQEFQRLIGTSKASMMGRQIKSFMPIPFQRFHQGWVEKYIEDSTTMTHKIFPTKWIVSESGFFFQGKVLVNIIPSFEEGLEFICTFTKKQNKRFVLCDTENNKIVGFSQQLFRCFYDRKITKNQYIHCVSQIKLKEMMPFACEPTAPKKVSLSTTDPIFQHKSIQKQYPVGQIVNTPSLLPNIKSIQIIFAEKTSTFETTGTKTLTIPKSNNCMHPQLSVSNISIPYYLLLLPFVLRFLFYDRFQLKLPFVSTIDSKTQFLDLSVSSCLHIQELKNGVNITALPQITELQLGVFGYIPMSEEFLDVLTINGLKMSAINSQQPELDTLAKLSHFDWGWQNIAEEMGVVVYQRVGLAVVLLLFGLIYVHQAYKILETRRMKKLICEAFTVLKLHELDKILFKLEGLYEYFEQFSNITNLQLNDEAESTISTLPVQKEQEWQPPKTLLQKAHDIIVKLLISITFDSEKVAPKRLIYNCRHLYWHLWVLAFFVVIAIGVHIGCILILSQFGRELGSIFASYHKTQDMIPSLKLQVANCFEDTLHCKSQFLDELYQQKQLISKLPDEFKSYTKKHTELHTSANLCSLFQQKARYPNLSLSHCLSSDTGLYNSSFDQTIIHFIDLMRTVQMYQRPSSNFTALVVELIELTAYLEPVAATLRENFKVAFGEFVSKRSVLWIISEILSFASIAAFLFITKKILLIIQKDEESYLMLMKTIERSMFDTNMELKSKFVSYLPS